MTTVMQDLHYAVRVLARNPGFTVVAILVLALAIGANSTIFSMIKGVIFRPLPAVAEPENLVMLVGTTRSGSHLTLSYPDYRDFLNQNDVFSGLMAAAASPFNLSSESRPERVWGEMVSGNYFQLLGTKAAAGRLLLPSDDQAPGGHPVAVVSYGLWQRVFGSDTGLIGRTIRLNGRPFTVIGVAEKGFAGSMVGLALDIFVPVAMAPELKPFGLGINLLEERGTQWLVVLGRLKPLVTREGAEAEMRTLAARIARDYPNTNEGRSAVLFPLWRAPIGAQPFLLPLLSALGAVVGLVLLVACANVAALLLARAAGRRRESAIRAALGASRGRLARQMLTEGILLGLLGGGAGLLVAAWCNDLIATLDPPTSLPVALNSGFDDLVLGFTFLVSLVAGGLCSLAPASVSSKLELVPALKDDVSGWRHRRSRLRSGLVVAQVAISLAALIAAGLVIRSLVRAAKVDCGFKAEHVLLAALDLTGSRYTDEQGRVFYRQLLQRVGALPGVESACLARQAPLDFAGYPQRGVTIEGYQPRPDEDMFFPYNVVSPGYFDTMGIPFVAGRDFRAEDNRRGAPVVIVNEAMARRFWPGRDPLGKRLRINNDSREVVGVVRNSKYRSLAESPEPHLYRPVFQEFRSDLVIHIRTKGNPMNVRSALEQEVHGLDANLPILQVHTLSDQVDISLYGYRLSATLLAGFGLVALALASLGLYGVIAYSVAQRTNEIGVRMALGAHPGEIFRLVLGEGMRLMLFGMALGWAGALALSRFLSALLFQVTPTDPITFVAVPLLLAGAALLACAFPAWRALRVDPIVALRHE